jgi:hypothetical protein
VAPLGVERDVGDHPAVDEHGSAVSQAAEEDAPALLRRGLQAEPVAQPDAGAPAAGRPAQRQCVRLPERVGGGEAAPRPAGEFDALDLLRFVRVTRHGQQQGKQK